MTPEREALLARLDELNRQEGRWEPAWTDQDQHEEDLDLRVGRIMASLAMCLLSWGDEAIDAAWEAGQEPDADPDQEDDGVSPRNDFSRCASAAMQAELVRRGILPSNDPDRDDAEILANMPIAALETEIQNRGYRLMGEEE